jgi:hypothetical protein
MPESAASPTNAFRQKVLRNYHDHAQVTEPNDTDTDLQCGDERKGPSGGVKVPFPTKLHLMLSMVEGSGSRHIVSWWDPLHLSEFCCSDMRQKTKHIVYTSLPGNHTDDALWCTSRRNLWRMSCRLASANRNWLHSSVSWIYMVSPALLKVLIVVGTTTSCSWGTSCSCAEWWWDIAFSDK